MPAMLGERGGERGQTSILPCSRSNCAMRCIRLIPGHFYRHDSVYVVGAKAERTGLPWQALPERMGELAAFIREDSEIDDLLKAALIHFYVAYLHPHIDGNGRMARLMHLWYLMQQGYSSARFVPLSEYISRKGYYDAYTLVEENAGVSGIVDATPFLTYFIENAYHKLNGALSAAQATAVFQAALSQGQVTEKDRCGRLFYRLTAKRSFPQADGKGLRKRRLRDDPQLCTEIREARFAQIHAVWESRKVCGSYELRKAA